MKNLLLISLLLLLSNRFMAQEWVQSLPEEKFQEGSLTFIEIQKAFNDYNLEHGIVDGKRNVNGQMVKEPGWKQFKRWEWYWESRVNPETGVFPETSATDAFRNYIKTNPVSKSASGDWKTLGPSTSDGGYAGIGRVNCIAFHPSDNNTFWIGAPSGGLWKTTDGGSTWTVLTDNNAVLGVSDIAIPSDYATSNTIYIATGDRDGGSVWSLGSGASNDNNSIGVLKSTNGGTSWNTTGLTYLVSQNKKIGRLLIHPTNTNILLAGTSDGIKKSIDGGTNWTSEYTGAYIIDMEFKPGDPSVVYAANSDYWGTALILKSTNTGDSWTAIKNFTTTDYRVEIAVTPNDATYIYAIVANRNSGLTGIFKSMDSGATFTQLVNGDDTNKGFLGYYSDGSGGNTGQGSYDLSIAVSPSDKNTVVIGGVNSWKTTDGGLTWNICNMWTSYSGYNLSSAPEVHADKHAHVFRSDGTLFEGNDGGIYKSSDNGTTWTDLSNGLRISQIYRLGVSQTDFNMTITGLQDNGSKLVDGNSWYDVTGGDGMECIIDYTDKNIQYATYVNGTIYRTTALWNSSVTISENIPGDLKGAWVTPYIIDPNNNSTLYVGYADVWKTTNKGDSFTKISTMNTADYLRSMAIAPTHSNYLYVADHDNLWKTTNGGTSWIEITGTLPITTNKITYVTVKNSDENTIWVTMGGYDTKRVYESTNGGSTWVNISSGLPQLPVMSLVQNKLVTEVDQLYVGSDVGVYVKHGDEDWKLFSTGLPNVVVTELDIYYNSVIPANSKLRAATFGRGLWESDLYSQPTVAPIANFIVSDSTIQQGQSVTFTDLSSHEPSTWSWIFAGGNPATSSEQNPVVTYNTAGSFDVELTVTNVAGTDTKSKVGFMVISPPQIPISGFTASATTAFAGSTIQFTDTSLNFPTSWSWIFDGGTPAVSSLQNPSITYETVGNYAVTLTATNSAGSNEVSKTAYIIIEEVPDLMPPTNLQATINENDVTLTWEKPEVVTLISEGFENTWPPVDWTVKYSATLDGVHSDPTETSWFQCDENSFANGPNPEYIHSGTFSAAIGYTAPEFNWFISPEFVVNLGTNLNYWIWYYSTSTYTTLFHVMLKDGTEWIPLKEYGTGSAINEFGVVEEISLADYYGKTVQVAFVYEYNDGYQLMIDDVFIGNSNSGYQVYRDDVKISTLANPETLTYSDAELSGGNYSYYVTAYYGASTNESGSSNTVDVVVYDMALANFSGNPTSGVFPLEVTFTNSSANADTYAWDFGDGATSTLENPVHIYNQAGIYTVKLTASNANNSDIEEKINYITATYPVVTASYTGSPTTGIFPLEVSFTNSSANADTYVWDFGDGATSTLENPVHTYNQSGTFSVKLTASNEGNSDVEEKLNYITATFPEAVAGFTANPTSGEFPLQVNFTNTSTNANVYDWAFGDGFTSSETNPVHTYETAGNFTVILNASNTDFSDSETKSNYISASWPLPVADFSANPNSGIDPLVVTFTDLSEYAQNWNWNFGDGTNSTEQNPEHRFTQGTYSISLAVTNPSGSNQITKENIITVDPTGIPEAWQNRLKVFPNPASEFILVQLENKKADDILISLFDLQGKQVYKSILVNDLIIEKRIHVKEFDKGSYLLKIEAGSEILVMGIVIN